MRFHRLSVFHIPGISELPENQDVIIIASSDDLSRSRLTRSTASFSDILIDRGAFVHLFGFIFVPPDPKIIESLKTPEERFGYARSLVKLNLPANSTFLITEVIEDVEIASLNNVARIGTVGQFLDELDFTSLIAKSERVFRHSFTGVSLCFSDHEVDTTNSIGSAIWVDEEKTGCRLFAMRPKISGHLTVGRGLTGAQAELASRLALKIGETKNFESCARLLSQASEKWSDKLLSFLSAWTSLEIFIQEVFKTTYEPEYFRLFSKSVPAAAAQYVDTIREVMESKYNIREKFIAVASMLDNDNAKADIDKFKELKKFRDGLAHSMKGEIESLPSEAIQSLTRKYLRLHLLRLTD